MYKRGPYKAPKSTNSYHKAIEKVLLKEMIQDSNMKMKDLYFKDYNSYLAIKVIGEGLGEIIRKNGVDYKYLSHELKDEHIKEFFFKYTEDLLTQNPEGIPYDIRNHYDIVLLFLNGSFGTNFNISDLPENVKEQLACRRAYTKLEGKEIEVECPYCKIPTKLITSEEEYGKSGAGLGYRYRCPNCGASCGVQKGSKLPLGFPANKELKTERQAIYKLLREYIDVVGREKKELYDWLSKEIGLPSSDATIAHYNLNDCQKAKDILNKKLSLLS